MQKLPPTKPLADTLDVCERFTTLDSLMSIAVSGGRNIDQLGTSPGATPVKDQPWGRLFTNSIDFDPAMRNANQMYDRCVAAARLSDRASRKQELAQIEHVSGRNVIKPVVVKADGQFVLCALPASYKVDLKELRSQLRADDVKLADEQSLEQLFQGCELGAEPPIGRLWGLPTLMDESLTADDMVTFQAGTHSDSVTMSLAEYRRVAQPEIAHFGRQT